MMNTNVEHYFENGCGRCPLGGTPDCKVHNWDAELSKLRSILLDCMLTEESKWGVPCYTFQKKNVVILAAFKTYCALSFFKGALLSNPEKLLVKAGENTATVRLLKFTTLKEIEDIVPTIKSTIFEAIEIEKAGLKVETNKKTEPITEELLLKMNTDPKFKAAFEALTPGRQRGYNLFFSAPKQAKTRASRIEKSKDKIMQGKGLNER